jgi:hypothetical protein
MGFLDRFRREGEPLPQLEPDDPRVAELADELDRAGGVTFDWRLLWSGPLLGDGDAATEAVTLLRKRWWHFNGEAKLIEIDEESALELLAWLFGYSLAYESELMPPERAATVVHEWQ